VDVAEGDSGVALEMGGKYPPPNRFEFVVGRNYGAVIRKEKARTINQ
jgi:hypothetical protein